ncbi:MAG: hypothetical protein WBA89_05015 [Microcoleus sp.]
MTAVDRREVQSADRGIEGFRFEIYLQLGLYSKIGGAPRQEQAARYGFLGPGNSEQVQVSSILCFGQGGERGCRERKTRQ